MTGGRGHGGALSESDLAEVAVLAQLGSPEAVTAFELMRHTLQLETAPRFVELLTTINRLSGPGFAERASLELLDAVHDSGDLELVETFAPSLGDATGALALAQLLRTYHCADE
ncbi:hypothetical protein CH253_17870 [Rhodococcus sp. 06-156-3C]|uniref:hypothetical protein n=1 Tax=Nocardiaceae TaxID=85025 RepID=UPI0009B81CC8|nr:MULTISPECIES: hypothetical protein [Rhodococcus]OZD18382.1 hypothetical protein CH280_07195 [Rhodococcus sp. 06-156-4C]OZD18979.1 hypothetical protein CH253_17870 [Rhodococcus sp. 06-156-3C]OZD22492.1 hypothetical protein CH248_09455 [Rhodococcus sp. 06-156-4a]OZD34163.1 hypothetical protein CH247_07985 [Rhodococcus sp. 06-156-3b]OZD38900.1 hypothetical protein CH284_06405 [Rhodococcus sp. 06-156-3]